MGYRRFQLWVCLITIIFLIAKTPVWNMVWDADGYLHSSISIVTGLVYDNEQLYYRGILTSVVFLIPSFVGLKFLEPSVFGTYIYVLVLIQNALIVSLMGSYMVPRLIELFIPKSKYTLIVTSLISVYAFQAFVPYSLIDLFAVALLIPSVYLMKSERHIIALIYGLTLGISVNLRPAFLATAIFLAVCAAAIHRYRSVYFFSGLIVSHIPQATFNWLQYKSFSFLALGSGEIATSNFSLAATAIRVDTRGYPYVGEPQALFFCDKTMFDISKRSDLNSIFDMLLMFARNPIDALVFEVKKLSTAVWWPVTIPYYDHNPIVNTVFGAVISFVVVFGTSMLLFLFVKSDTKKNFLGLIAVYFGFLANIILYTNEPRYGLPIIVVSISGFVLLCMKQFTIPVANAIPELTRNWKMATTVFYLIVVLIAMLVVVGDRGFSSLSACR
jgi:hypothetical protein